MDTKNLTQALEKVLAEKGKRKFTQSVDLVMNLKGIDIKKTDQQLDLFVLLPHLRGNPNKICGLVGQELIDEAKRVFDFAIDAHFFDDYKDKTRKIKKLSRDYDFFVAQANIMPQVATVFGKVLGPRGRMPNPKAGCVVPPKFALEPLKDKLVKTVRVSAKTSLSIKIAVGKENQPVKEIADNIMTIYKEVIAHTPQGKENIKNVMVKLTMGIPVKVE
jgi:large subunit ribosomal protein L1